MKVKDWFHSEKIIILDGGTGTMLQQRGLQPGQSPEILSLTQPELLVQIHREYAQAGAQILCANTFGASERKLAKSGYTVEEVIHASLRCAREAAEGTGAAVALDVSTLGEMLEPNGTLRFEDAYRMYSRIMRAGAEADAILIETMTDLYEVKAALLAAKENSDLPVMVSMSFEENGRTFTGCCVESFAAAVVGLGADAIGINCSLGPVEIRPLMQRLCECVPADFPVFAKPNAGLPHADGSGYDITPAQFVQALSEYADFGVTMLGGCCGTTPEYIRLLKKTLEGKTPAQKNTKTASWLCTPMCAVNVDGITVVGERINPTGKKRFQQALREGDMDYILRQAVEQQNAGAKILDVNVGLPDIDEPAVMERVVKALQSVIDLPLQLDSSNPEALERGLRVYNGKPIVNSVNGERKVLDSVLPLCRKYGAAVVGLTLDENGIPSRAEERFAIAERITRAAEAAGIGRQDVYIDCLTLTASSQQAEVMETLKALKMCKERLGVRTVLGVSNISFGLPARVYLNTAFLTMAMMQGLDLAIINPNVTEMTAAVAAYRVLANLDRQSVEYIAAFSDAKAALAPSAQEMPLEKAVEYGLKKEAADAARAALKTMEPMTVVNEVLIPALDRVGDRFEKGILFLPQLLQAAGAAQSAFEIIKEEIARSGRPQQSQGKIVIATVKGDIHDIGKNIVKVILENYGYQVCDLGRDVPPEKVVHAVQETGAPLVGLSALMTTTVKSMEQTVRALRESCPTCRIMVGGAVLTPDYAETMGADYYVKDAKASADVAKAVFQN